MIYSAPPSRSTSETWHVAGSEITGTVVPLAGIREALASFYPVVVRDRSRDLLLLAQAFAARAGTVAGVREVWVSRGEALRVVAVTDDLDLQRELRLRREFIELVRSTDERATAELLVFSATDDWTARMWPDESTVLTRIMPGANGH